MTLFKIPVKVMQLLLQSSASLLKNLLYLELSAAFSCLADEKLDLNLRVSLPSGDGPNQTDRCLQINHAHNENVSVRNSKVDTCLYNTLNMI